MVKEPRRKHMMAIAFLAFCLILAAGGAMASDLDSSLANGGIRLAGSELAALYSGRTWSGMTATGSAFSPKYAADGTGVLTFKNEDQPGKWRVDGNKGCTSWAKVRSGKEACFAIVKLPDGSYAAFESDGSANSSFTVK